MLDEDRESTVTRRRALAVGLGAFGGVALAIGLPGGAAHGTPSRKRRTPVAKPVPLGRLEIPKLRVGMTMVEGITTPSLNAGPAHWPGTPLPGQPGNVVIAGHRVSHHRVFRNIDQLVPGDEILCYVTFASINTGYRYRVTGAEIVNPVHDAGRVLTQTAASTMTLFACHPPGSTRQRYIVHATMA